MLKSIIVCLGVTLSLASTACVTDKVTDAEAADDAREASTEVTARELCPDVCMYAPPENKKRWFIYKPVFNLQTGDFLRCQLTSVGDYCP